MRKINDEIRKDGTQLASPVSNSPGKNKARMKKLDQERAFYNSFLFKI